MMQLCEKEMIKQDLYRYYGEAGRGFKDWLNTPVEVRYLIVLRKIQYRKKGSPLWIWYSIRLRAISFFSHIQIPYKANIGPGLYIGHSGRIIISPFCQIGKNCNIATGVTIGQEYREQRKGAPVIGDDVWIGTNSVIVGDIIIGNDVMIAPLSFVNFDVPDHSIVIGNPGMIKSKGHATEGYINNRV